MPNFVKVANVDDIPSGEALQVETNGLVLALVRANGDVYCVQDVCTHEQAFLSEGFCENHEIECPLHGSIFDIRTGEVKSLPATEPLKTYPVKIEDGAVLVDVEA
jgi:nitrite reductase/ring-hydroxylating ferredoxin subunit